MQEKQPAESWWADLEYGRRKEFLRLYRKGIETKVVPVRINDFTREFLMFFFDNMYSGYSDHVGNKGLPISYYKQKQLVKKIDCWRDGLIGENTLTYLGAVSLMHSLYQTEMYPNPDDVGFGFSAEFHPKSEPAKPDAAMIKRDVRPRTAEEKLFNKKSKEAKKRIKAQKKNEAQLYVAIPSMLKDYF